MRSPPPSLRGLFGDIFHYRGLTPAPGAPAWWRQGWEPVTEFQHCTGVSHEDQPRSRKWLVPTAKSRLLDALWNTYEMLFIENRWRINPCTKPRFPGIYAMVVNHLRHLFRWWTFLTGRKGSHNLEPKLTMGTNQVRRWDDPPGGPGKLDGEPANFGKAAAGRVQWPMAAPAGDATILSMGVAQKVQNKSTLKFGRFFCSTIKFLGALLSQSQLLELWASSWSWVAGALPSHTKGRAAIRVQRISGLPQAFWDKSLPAAKAARPSIPSFWIFQAFSSGCIWIWVPTPQTRLCLYWKSCCLNGRSSPNHPQSILSMDWFKDFFTRNAVFHEKIHGFL